MLGIIKVMCFNQTTLCTDSIRSQDVHGFPAKRSTSLIRSNIVAPGFGHVQLHVPRDLGDDCQPYRCKVTSSVEMME